MDYLYENLGDERFQEFCSAIVSKEFPNVQTFPVGQPDGGRDSLVFRMDTVKKEFIVFQVKYVRNANQERDIHAWLEDTIKKEVEKIQRLIPKGAKSYYLLTNVRGTAHLDSGSKDKVNKILEDNIKIPSICWWRDDLNMLFEKDPLFKWSFPDILNGQDILNSTLFSQLNENKERRESVINAYLTDQFDMDNEVKFKQIDLQNKLLNLFTDVPLRLRKFNEKNSKLWHTMNSFNHRKVVLNNDDIYVREERIAIGAAEFILHSKIQNEIERMVLEGGPGQGKSTISQYICQVHRARLLNKISDVELLPDSIRITPIRLPIKIDLRDVASWVEKKNPYQAILGDDYFVNNWRNSLESFIVGHFLYHSKLEEFSTSDFIAIGKLSPILFVFDGFDEIADIKIRSEVVDFINKGLTRFNANFKSLQVVITSRPSAFTDSVSFSIENYPHFDLTDITPQIINEYVEKWIKASRLDSRDASELRKLIKEKLEMPHLRDLAKSPMQLAIFISLLRTKGQSLPNKRTELFDNYISLFFDREAEKDTLIRDKRDLIIDIHQYLAWILHSEAELYKNSGSIKLADLKDRLKDYLEKEGHETSITDQLFEVVKVRVCALVSRVEGTFEFEVQPLREYFCAKYLYKSAPHSSAGSVKHGTKPDRLHAILRNYYWQNVVRFFAGCVDVGELDMLIQELKDLQKDELLKYTDYPRIITSQILSDYVFTQKPLKLKDVVKIIVDGISISNIINQNERLSSSPPLLLPNECGRREVLNECFDQLSKFPNSDYAADLIGIINNNELNNLEIWLGFRQNYSGQELTKWLEYAYKLQLIHRIDEKEIYLILQEDSGQIKKRLQFLINGNRVDIINKKIEYKKIVVQEILNQEMQVFPEKNNIESSLISLTVLLHSGILSQIFDGPSYDITLLSYLTRFIERPIRSNSTKRISEFTIDDEVDKNVKRFYDKIVPALNVSLIKFNSSIEPWDLIVESGRSEFGDAWSFKLIATIAAAIKSKDELYEEFDVLRDNSVSLCKRVRCARMRSGNLKYWDVQLNTADDKLFVLLVFFTWVTPKTIIHFISIISKMLKSLTSDEFAILRRGLSYTIHASYFNKNQQKDLEQELKDRIDVDGLNYVLSLRINDRPSYVYNNIRKYKGITESAIKQKNQYLFNSFLTEPNNPSVLSEIKDLYKKNQFSEERHVSRQATRKAFKLTYEMAKEIMKDCKNYPRVIGSIAESVCREYANEHTKPVGEIALREKWFQDN